MTRSQKLLLALAAVALFAALPVALLLAPRPAPVEKPAPAGGEKVTTPADDGPQYVQGWVDDPATRLVVNPTKLQFAETPANKAVQGELPPFKYLWQSGYQKLFGRPPPERNQGQVGSCTGFGGTGAAEATLACDLAAGRTAGEFREIAQEALYGGMRVQILHGQIRGDGGTGQGIAEFVTKYGLPYRGVYGSLDLTKYSEATCRTLGSRGLPADVQAEAKKFPIKDAALVKSWAEAKKALANEYGIAVCSNQGFVEPGTRGSPAARDANGCCKPNGSWAHCMCLDGYHTDEAGREWGHITNSWGDNAHTGPVGWGSPNKAGFWTDAKTVDKMLAYGDSWAFSGTKGFPARPIVWEQGADAARPVRREAFRPADLLTLAH